MRVTKGCPLCRGDVFGTFETGFYCKACNLMYRKRHVLFSEVRDETKLLITKHFSGFGPKDRVVETEQYETVLDIPEKKRRPSPNKKPGQDARPQQAAPRPTKPSKTATPPTASPKPQAMKKAAAKKKATGKTTKKPRSKKTVRPKRQAQASKKQTKGLAARPTLADHPAAALLEAAGPSTSKKSKKQGKKPGLEDLL